jgi:hypothetical protein
MTQPDTDSSPEYNPYELFTEELDLDAFELEQTPPPRTIATHQESTSPPASTETPFATQDEDRLYTDELIRQNEMASRSLFLSTIAAAIISVGIGLWYLFSQKPTPTPQPVAPLPVPEQPVFAPPIAPSSIAPSPIVPSIPTTPSNQIPPLAPTDSGIVPGGLPTSKPTVPTQTSPSGETVPPPPPLPGKSNR